MAPVTMTLTLDDVVRGQRLYLRTRRSSRLFRLFLMATLAAVAALLFAMEGLNGASAIFVPVLLINAGILAWLYHAETWGTPPGARGLFRQLKVLHGPIQVSWTEEGYKVDAELGTWRTPWRDFVSWAEDDAVVIIFQTDRLFNLAPKRFADPNGFDELRGHLARAGIPRLRTN